jgi:hypothetical protein
MNPENPKDIVKPITPEDLEKQTEYKKGKRIQLPDGSIITVYSVKEEIEAREKAREK